MGSGFLGDLKPDSALRNIDLEEGSKLDHHRLFASMYHTTGNGLDIYTIELFGLWNPETCKIDCRIRHGFRVFTLRGETNAPDPILLRSQFLPGSIMQGNCYAAVRLQEMEVLKVRISPVSAVPPACKCVVVGADMKITKSATRVGFVKS